MDKSISFYVAGIPVPQGSSRAFVVKGRAVITHANKETMSWRQRIATEAQRNRPSDWTMSRDTSYCVNAVFVFPRPPSAKEWKRKRPIVKPDLDKLIRNLNDALTDILWVDDCQVTCIEIEKRYVDNLTPNTGVCITVIEQSNIGERPMRNKTKDSEA